MPSTPPETNPNTAPLSHPASNPHIKTDSAAKFFIIGGLSGATASSIVHPIDTLKARCQTANESRSQQTSHTARISPATVARHILASEGVRSLYRGLDSSIFRQITYATARLGIYKCLYDRRLRMTGDVPFTAKLRYSLFAGLCGAVVGNPADLTLVRRQTDLELPVEQRRNYRNVFNTFGRIIKEEGVVTLWKGTPFTILRVCALTSGQMITFDEIKERTRVWRQKPDDIYNRLAAASVSGLICSVSALPFDNVKVKLQKMTMNADGTWPYSGLSDVVMKTIKREGIRGFWTGLSAFYMLVGPHTLITLIVQDYLHVFWNKSASIH